MPHRDHKATDGVTAPRVESATMTAAGRDAVRPMLVAEGGSNRSWQWEELYRKASPAQRAEMLALALRQGFLYSHQVCTESNGKRTAPLLEDPGHLQMLANLQARPSEHWPPVPLESFTPIDPDLDLIQRQGVARALASPDICLISGLPGTGKSRLLAEIVTQVVLRGQRVLFLAPRTAAIDTVLAHVGQRDALYAIRCLEPGEKPETLPAPIRDLTFSDRTRNIREALCRALQAQEAAQHRYHCCRGEESLWPQLEQLAEKADAWQQRRAALQQAQAQVPLLTAAEANQVASSETTAAGSFFVEKLWAEKRRAQDSLGTLQASLEELESRLARQQDQRKTLEEEEKTLAPLARAKRQGRWWSPAWWRATLRGKVLSRMEELEAELPRAQAQAEQFLQEINGLRQLQQNLENEHRSAQDEILQEEMARRQEELSREEALLIQESQGLEKRWQELVGKIGLESLRPVAMTSAAVREAHERWQKQLRAEEENSQFARRWAAFLQSSSETLTARLPTLANLVAGTFSALAADKHFGEATGLVFDLLILEEANQLSEADFFKLARRARRWLLVGEPIWQNQPLPRGENPGTRNAVGPRPALSPSSFFQRLWQYFHCDPQKLSYAWLPEGDRLCCRMRPLPTGQKYCLESENLADSPDIELRILSSPPAAPVLAEVVFPATFSLSQAKQHIYRELQELAVQTPARGGYLIEEPDRLVFHLAGLPGPRSLEVPLDNGIREMLEQAGPLSVCHPAAWKTTRLEFEKSAGWNRDLAAQWIHNHLHLKDLGRTAFLDVSYRMQPGLFMILSDLLFRGEHAGILEPFSFPLLPARAAKGQFSPLVFVPVPSLRGKGNSRANDKNPGLLPREGAGLELDLSAPRQGDRLPQDLRKQLPARGLVNFCEAQAVVRKVEELAADPAHRAALTGSSSPAIAVMALYAGQVQLIRNLLQRSPGLRQCPVPLEVGLPGAFSHREFLTVFLSLTRSSNRAVAYGEEISQVALALTRARSQVILFGDPGTLVRRSQWHGRVDHLDEAAAGREELLIKDLVRYLQGRGKHAWAFHLCEGNP